MIRFVFLFACSLLVASTAHAVDRRRSVSEYVLAQFGEGEGLPQSVVFSVAQEPNGFLWVGTVDGIARFDGVRFTFFDKATTSVLSRDTTVLLDGHDGAIWVGTRGAGLLRLEHGAFSREVGSKQELERVTVQALAEGTDGSVWIGTAQDGLFRMKGSSLEHFGKDFPSTDIRAIASESPDRIWIGTGDKGVVLGKREGAAWKWTVFGSKEKLPSTRIDALTFSKDGVLWVGHGRGVSRIEKETVVNFSAKGGVPIDSVNALLTDRDGNLWIGTGRSGLYRYTDDEFQHLGERDGLSSDRIESLYEDNEGNIWVATSDGGLTRVNEGAVWSVSSRTGLPNDLVNAVYEDNKGDLWFATEDGVASLEGGLEKGLAYGELDFTFYLGDKLGLRDASVSTFFEFKNDMFIAGQGIAERDAKRFKREGPNETVHAAITSKSGDAYIGVESGLLKYDGRHFTKVAAVPSERVLSLLEDKPGSIWFGTNAKLCHLDGEKLGKCFQEAEGLNAPVVALYVDPKGLLWIGTMGGGLGVIDGDSLEMITARQGLVSDGIASIVDDPEGNLWLGSTKGIARVRRDEMLALARGSTTAASLLVLDKSDGMKSRECRGHAIRDRKGRLWFSTLKGAAMVDPARIQRSRGAPPVYVEGAVVDGSRRGAASSMTLPFDTRRLEIEFTSPRLSRPEKVRFRYKMSGIDPEWVDADARRIATYTSLAPGAYQFKVVALNEDGLSSESTVAITVEGGARPRQAVAAEPKVAPQSDDKSLIAFAACGVLALALVVMIVVSIGKSKEIATLRESATDDVPPPPPPPPRAMEPKRDPALVRELEDAQAALRATQANLIRSEQIASMASLVTGVVAQLKVPVTQLSTQFGPLRQYLSFLTSVGTTLSDGRARRPDEIASITRFGRADLKSVGAELTRLVGQLEENGRRMVAIVGDLESMTRGANRTVSRVNVARVLDEAVRRSESDWKGRMNVGISISDPTIEVDAVTGHLEQLVSNVLDNSIRAVAMAERSSTDRKIMLSAVREGPSAVITIADNGAGMSEDILKRAADPFFTTREGGSGLGLSISSSIARAHNGNLEIESTPGQGTKITVHIPLSA